MENNTINWDEYFMGLALLSAMRSKDNHTKVGACIVNDKNRIVGLGYNGMPNGCKDEDMPWEYGTINLHTKYYYVVHAELNAILNANTTNLSNCTIFTTLFPCCECAKAIVQCGIKRIVYYSDKYSNDESTIASKLILKKSGVEYKEYNKTNNNLHLPL